MTNQDINLSYWEKDLWLSKVDFTIVGSGIVGLSCALSLRKRYPKSKILVLEKGILPSGASTKNAGFACFGSLSEILDDLKTHDQDQVFKLVKQRWEGLQLLRNTLGDTAIDFKQYGGFELFNLEDSSLFDSCLRERKNINTLLEPIFKAKAFIERGYEFGFKNINTQAIFNPFEGQLHTGKMMASLLERVQSKGVKILNSVHVKAFSETGSGVEISTAQFNFKTRKLLIATNGFAAQLIEQPVKPARAQVLITKPIKNLHIKGTFNLDRGYYYFRNINQRILFGGGRNLDFKAEETSEFGQTALVQNHLEKLLKTVILPDTPFEIEQRWSGIMGVGKQKKPIVKALSNHVYCGVRLGGMGVAIGSLIGKELADLL